MISELVHSLRRIARRPAFAALTVAMLAAGIGASAFVVSLYEQVAWRQLPVERPEELFAVRSVGVTAKGRSEGDSSINFAAFLELAEDTREQLELAAYGFDFSLLSEGDRTERIQTGWVSPNLLPLLGIAPAVGRFFDPVPRPDSPSDEVVLAHGTWLRRFAADPAVIGRTVRVDGRSWTIAGVAPKELRALEIGKAPEIYRLAGSRREAWGSYAVLGRIPAERTLAALDPVIRAAHQRFLERRPGLRQFVMVEGEMLPSESHYELVSAARGLAAESTTLAHILRLIAAMVAVVLAIVCANLANLLAVRATAERQQAAVRLALGAGRWAIARAWLVDALLLVLAGGALGALLAVAAGPALLSALPGGAFESAFEIGLDPLVLAVLTGLVALCAAVVGGLAAWESRRVDVADRLRGDGPTSTGGHSRARMRWTLVAAQVALGTLLVAGMGLLVRSLDRLLAIDTGYPLERVVTLRVELAEGSAPPSRAAAWDRIVGEVGALPGVTAAAPTSTRPLGSQFSSSWISVEGYEPAAGEGMMMQRIDAAPALFTALGLRVVRGALPGAERRGEALQPVVINRVFAERYFAGRDPVGRRLSYRLERGGWGAADPDDLVVAAVVEDGVIADLREQATPRVYVPFDRESSRAGLVVRTERRARDLLPELRRAVALAAPEALAFDFVTLEQQRDRALARERFLRDLALGFGLFAALLAATGLYGVLAYVGAERRREFALRSALGAGPVQLARTAAASGIVPVAVGLALGLSAALPAGRLLRGWLYGVEPADPAALAVALLLLLLAAAAASLPPALAAARTDPASTLRGE